MSSTYGETLKLSIFGQSHGAAIGMTLDGIPAGLPVDAEALQAFLNRRAPGRSDLSTPRKEEDRPEFVAGIVNGHTCGAPIAAMIHNRNFRSADYANLLDSPRPGHADYTAHVKYRGYEDPSGGGHFSGRLTAPLCIAGGLCKQWLSAMGIEIGAHILSVGAIKDDAFDSMEPALNEIADEFPVLNAVQGQEMMALIREAARNQDSVGGVIECAVKGLPVGLGEPMFGGVESHMAQIIYGIPAVKGLSFGETMDLGSLNNDGFTMVDGNVRTLSNHCGGVLGGITNGMPLLFKTHIKPTPSIGVTQQTVSFSDKENKELNVGGRHDPCILPRAVPVVEAAAAIAIFDMMLSRTDDRRFL